MRPPIALALLGALGAVSGAIYLAAVPAAGWTGWPLGAVHLGVFAVLFTLYLVALSLVARGAGAHRAALPVVLGFALLVRLAVIDTPVYLSSDVYRYLWEGRVQLAGFSPYRYPPSAPELAPLRDAEVHPRINRPEAVTIYPPAAQWLFAAGAAVAPNSVVGWRLLLLAADLGTLALLVRLLPGLGVAPVWVLAYAWSPLVVFEGVQAGHVDLALVPLVLLAFAWRRAGAPVAAGAALGLATLVKLYPAILVLAWWRRDDWRMPGAMAAMVGLAYLPYAATLGPAVLGFLPEYFQAHEDFNVGLRAALTWVFGLTGETARAALMAALVAALLAALAVIARTRDESPAGLWRAGALGVGAYLALVPTSMHPWYVVWLVPWLTVRPFPAWLIFSGAVTLSYVKYLVDPEPVPWWVWAGQWGVLYALLLVAAVRSRVWRPGGATAYRTTGA